MSAPSVADCLRGVVVTLSLVSCFACSDPSDSSSKSDGNAAVSTGTVSGTQAVSTLTTGGGSGAGQASAGGALGSTAGGGGSSSGGSGGTGGSSGTGGSGGAGGSPSTGGCKRGIAANVAPGAAFSGGVSWWYNWAIQGGGAGDGIEFVPMIWGSSTAGEDVPEGSQFLLGFNEPNFFAQANLSAEQAAAAWPEVEASAESVPIVSPGMNYCGPADQCHGTDPYEYLRNFFAACSDCQVDYVAVHWYNCDLPSLRDYLEPGGNLEGFEQFGKPIWLTEFSCDPGASVEDQEAYMREAIPYLEDNPNVFRYSWFSAGPIPNAKLINDDGSPTALGETYIGLPRACD